MLMCLRVFVCVDLENDVIISTALRCTSPKDSVRWIAGMLSCKLHVRMTFDQVKERCTFWKISP